MHNRHNFSIANLVAKSQDNRFKLSAVRVTPDKTIVTDGWVLAIVSTTSDEVRNYPTVDGLTPETEFEPFLLDAPQAQAVAKAIPKINHIPVLNHAVVGTNGDGKSRVIGTTDIDTKTVVKVDDLSEKRYPDWSKALPSSEPSLTISFNLKVLLPALRALAAFSDNPRLELATFRFYDGGYPLRIDMHNHDGNQHMTVAVMPYNEEVEAKDWTVD